jgi:hypothetical protein
VPGERLSASPRPNVDRLQKLVGRDGSLVEFESGGNIAQEEGNDFRAQSSYGDQPSIESFRFASREVDLSPADQVVVVLLELGYEAS